jgi:hypothetical protein
MNKELLVNSTKSLFNIYFQSQITPIGFLVQQVYMPSWNKPSFVDIDNSRSNGSQSIREYLSDDFKLEVGQRNRPEVIQPVCTRNFRYENLEVGVQVGHDIIVCKEMLGRLHNISVNYVPKMLIEVP